jgi:hypothetical protein
MTAGSTGPVQPLVNDSWIDWTCTPLVNDSWIDWTCTPLVNDSWIDWTCTTPCQPHLLANEIHMAIALSDVRF